MKTKFIIIYMGFVFFTFAKINTVFADKEFASADSGVSNGCYTVACDQIRDGASFLANMMQAILPDDIKLIYDGLSKEGKAMAVLYEKYHKSILKKAIEISKMKNPPMDMFPKNLAEPEEMAVSMMDILLGKNVSKKDYKSIGAFVLMLYNFKGNTSLANPRNCKQHN